MTYLTKIHQRHLPCVCWDCLRAQGITPPRHLLHKHPDTGGKHLVRLGDDESTRLAA